MKKVVNWETLVALVLLQRSYYKHIHPLAKMMNIIHHRWTVIFHIEDAFVIVDRIIHSSRMSL
jgi:hypothetical protein